jgi:hypothetical protein
MNAWTRFFASREMGNHLSFLVYHHNGGGSSFTVAQYDLESKKLPEATQEANGSIRLQGART